MSDFKDIIQEGVTEDHVLSSAYEIEDVLLLINQINDKIEYYKNLREYRVKSIDTEITSLSQKTEILRKVILNTMCKIAPDEKTLNFPSIGKVSRRKGLVNYKVINEDEVLDFLDQKGCKDDVVKTETKIDKRKLKTLVKQFQKSGETVPGVDEEVGNESLSIAFDKSDAIVSKISSESTVDIDKLDSLTV